MNTRGFAIRCPHCEKWNVWADKDPDNVAASASDFAEILEGLKKRSKIGTPWLYSHPKLIRCTRPKWACPSSFEAVVFRSRKEAQNCLRKIPEEWPFKRDFRLFKADCRERWEGQYYGILFGTPPFERDRNIELENLMDRELLRRLIVGIGHELQAPCTIYAASLFDSGGSGANVYWTPIEGYAHGGRLVPPRYNRLCQTCRGIIMDNLSSSFEDKHYSVTNCPIGFGADDKCAGNEAGCMQDPKDWNYCPAFLKERMSKCPCYSSDLAAIQALETRWQEGESVEEGIKHRCYMGFTELALPIVVHNHLVGVLMTGQVFTKPDEIAQMDEFVNAPKDPALRRNPWTLLKGHEEQLMAAKWQLLEEETVLKRDNRATCFIDKEVFDQRAALLRKNIDRIANMAYARYRDIRMRSESVFREELLYYIRSYGMAGNFLGGPVLNVLKRMRHFWRFEGTYLIRYSYATRSINLIAVSSDVGADRVLGLPGGSIAQAVSARPQAHPTHMLYTPGENYAGLNPFLSDLLKAFVEASKRRVFGVPKGRCYFFVLVPLGKDEVYSFVLTVRDGQGSPGLQKSAVGTVSRLCQEIILRVCTEIVHEFGYMKSYAKLREDAWRQFSAFAAHRIGNEISSVDNLLFLLTDEAKSIPALRGQWASDLRVMHTCIAAAKKMLTEQATLTAEITPELKVVNLETLVRKAASGVLARGCLEITPSASGIKLRVDAGLMEQAFRELCVNAVKAAGERLRLTVEGKKEKQTTVIRVRDNGPGIRPEDQIHIFEPHLGRHRRSGGLGLWTVRRIVEAHGGSIDVSSPPKEGATFTIELPHEGANR